MSSFAAILSPLSALVTVFLSVFLTGLLAIGLNAQQELTITVPSCSGGVGKLDVKFHGGASWLYNLFSGSIAGDQ